MGHYQTSTLLRKIGVVGAKDMTTESAIAKMMYLLGKGLKRYVYTIFFKNLSEVKSKKVKTTIIF